MDKLCSYCECIKGHVWPAQLAIGTCPGCHGHVLARRLCQCPTCNEPAERIMIRIDHLPDGGALLPVCKGAVQSMGGTLEIRRDISEEEQKVLKQHQGGSAVGHQMELFVETPATASSAGFAPAIVANSNAKDGS